MVFSLNSVSLKPLSLAVLRSFHFPQMTDVLFLLSSQELLLLGAQQVGAVRTQVGRLAEARRGRVAGGGGRVVWRRLTWGRWAGAVRGALSRPAVLRLLLGQPHVISNWVAVGIRRRVTSRRAGRTTCRWVAGWPPVGWQRRHQLRSSRPAEAVSQLRIVLHLL